MTKTYTFSKLISPECKDILEKLKDSFTEEQKRVLAHKGSDPL